MTVRQDPLHQTLHRIPTLTATIRTAHPDLHRDLNRIDHAAAQLQRWLPRAQQTITRSTLRSPNLEPHRGAGGHADPTGDRAVDDWGHTGKTRRGHAGKLDEAADRIRTAHQDLTRAAQGNLAPDVAGRVRQAREGLDRALSLVTATLPQPYDPKRDRIAAPPACSNCHTHGHHADAAPDRGGLCRWCADTRRAIGRNPDAELVHAHHAGRRVTRTLMDRLDRAAEHRRATKRAKTRAGRR